MRSRPHRLNNEPGLLPLLRLGQRSRWLKTKPADENLVAKASITKHNKAKFIKTRRWRTESERIRVIPTQPEILRSIKHNGDPKRMFSSNLENNWRHWRHKYHWRLSFEGSKSRENTKKDEGPVLYRNQPLLRGSTQIVSYLKITRADVTSTET